MRRRIAPPIAALLVTLGWLALTAGPASAHEAKQVGAYHFVVGFGDEPAYAGLKNSVELILSDHTGNPVTDLGPTLQVQVGFGDSQMPAMTMEPNFEVDEFGTPGDYRAFFFPTRPGDYSFHFTGDIKGQKVDETFASSPTTFSSVKDPTEVEFPAKDPTTGQLSERMDRELPRVQAAAKTAAASASDEAGSARTIGIVGIVVGALGLLAGGTALVAARRPTSGRS